MEKLFVNASEAARIVFGDGRPDQQFLTLEEAARTFLQMDEEGRRVSIIKTASGRVFDAEQADRLHRA